MAEQYTVMYVLGGPGSGKGTQCARIVDKYGWKHFSAGDLLRAEVKSGSDQGEELQSIMNEGGIVPYEITIGLIHKAMKDSGDDRFLIDGFPRALDQAEAFERMVCESTAMLFLDCPEAVMEARLLGRGEGRSDDNPETIKKRFRVYQEQTMPVIDKYEGLGKLRKVSAARTPDEVFADVGAIIEAIEDKKAEAPAAAAAAAEPAAAGGAGDLLGDLTGDAAVPAQAAPSPAQSAWAAPLPGASPPPVTTKAESSGGAPPVVIIGPSGVGKGTLIKRLLADARLGGRLTLAVSHTTRTPRAGEAQGEAYHFTSRDAFEADVAAGGFLEHADVHGNLYGTSRATIAAARDAGKVALLEIDVQGARQVRESPDGGDALFVFVKPASMEALEARLRGRGSESDDEIATRLANAADEIKCADDSALVDTVIVNDDLDAAADELAAAVAAHVDGTAPATAAAVPEPPRSRAKDYLNETVVGALKEALIELNSQRPEDPIQFLIDKLSALRGAGGAAGGPQPSLI